MFVLMKVLDEFETGSKARSNIVNSLEAIFFVPISMKLDQNVPLIKPWTMFKLGHLGHPIFMNVRMFP